MTDIAALIERLNSAGTYLGNAIAGYRDDDFKRSAKGMVDAVRAMQDAAAALSRLTAPPPDKIAGLIERLEHPMWVHGPGPSCQLAQDVTQADMKEAAAALRAAGIEGEPPND